MSGNNSRLMDPESHRETTSQERPFYATIDRKAPFNEPPIDPVGTGPVGASSQLLRTRDPHFEDHRTPTEPLPASSSRQTSASRKDFGGPEVELDIRPRGSQPPVGADNSQSVAVHPTSYSNPSDISASKEAPSRVGRHEAVTSLGPILSTRSIPPTTRPSPATIPPPSQNVPSARTSQETRGSTSFGLPRMEAPGKGDLFPPPQTDSHRDRNENRPRALQVDRPPSVQSSAQSFDYPPPSLNRPNLPTTPSPSPPAPALTTTASGRVQAPVRYGAAPPESPRPYNERNVKGYAEETRYANPSAASHKQQSPPVLTVPLVRHPSQPQPASQQRRFVKDNSRIQGIEEIDREAQRPTDGLTSDKARSASRASREAKPESKAGSVVIAPSALQPLVIRSARSPRRPAAGGPAPSQRRTTIEEREPLPPKLPLSGRPRPPQAPDEIVPPRLAAVPPIAERSISPGGVVSGSTQEIFSYLPSKKFPRELQLAGQPGRSQPPGLKEPEEREPLAFGPPQVPFSGPKSRLPAPGEFVPPPRLGAVPPIAQHPVPHGVVVSGSTQETFSNIASQRVSSAGPYSPFGQLDDENYGSGQGRSVGDAPHWKGQAGGLSESGLPESHRAASPRALPVIRPVDSHRGEQENARLGPPGVGPQEHTKGAAHADATCWGHFRSLFSRSSRKSSPN